MIKVALVTNWLERCGVSRYAANLVAHYEHNVKGADICFKIVERPLTFEHIFAETRDVDIIHVNYASGLFSSIRSEQWGQLKQGDKNLTMTFHDSSQEMIQTAAKLVYKDEHNRWCRVFDCVVVHEKAHIVPYPENVCVIPQPLQLADVRNVKIEPKIGTAGFPFPWKGFIPAAVAANKLHLGYLALMSKSDQIDAEQSKKQVLEICPDAEVVIDWFDEMKIIRRLAECFVNVFAYELDYAGRELYGISAAVRLGIATGRPVIVSRCSQFRDLFEYEDEVYFMDNGLDHALAHVVDDWNNRRARVPKRILTEMNWAKCAYLYAKMWTYVNSHWVVSV